MICIKEDCEKSASATIDQDVLDVRAGENRWLTAEPTFIKIVKSYCKHHFNEEMNVLENYQAAEPKNIK
ncbi:hypothetical protein ESOMN_v1c00450 [Williamsoniiplasma somnilux]|uniref:Uncharacterized protein n=1 Tax=Williamsoniiplasma somnilux TaxID=215578 RepID=A0A2K8P0A2_9MOLU|nr:hypothetical protein [Williamsoniiplasma somnilux]ATZ18431.1 hypothetical protein ESOMN_v1c00450 [Williamsoniiplasma somnilux]